MTHRLAALALALPLSAAAEPALTTVTFTTREEGTFRVEVYGPRPASCEVPCTLEVPPGLATVQISGDLALTRNVQIPEGAARVEVLKSSTGVRVIGAALATAGMAGSAWLAVTEEQLEDTTAAEARQRFGIAVADLALVVSGTVLVAAAGRSGLRVGAAPSGPHLAAVGPVLLRQGAGLGAQFGF